MTKWTESSAPPKEVKVRSHNNYYYYYGQILKTIPDVSFSCVVVWSPVVVGWNSLVSVVTWTFISQTLSLLTCRLFRSYLMLLTCLVFIFQLYGLASLCLICKNHSS